MNKIQITKEHLRTIIPKIDREYCSAKLSIRKSGDNYYLWYGKMYEALDISLDQAVELKKLFNADDIKRERINQPGCESCDWGSFYGYEIEIVNPRNTYIFEEPVEYEEIIWEIK